MENILKSRGFADLKDNDVTRDFLPIVINRVPQDIARDIPTTTLFDAIEYLKRIDRIKYDLNQCFLEGRKLEKSPSQAYNALINRARKALPGLTATGQLDPAGHCPEEHLKTVAWTSLKTGLPAPLSALAMAQNIRFFPTSEQLEALDDAWADLNSSKEVPSVFSVKTDNETSTSSNANDKTSKQLVGVTNALVVQAKQFKQLGELVQRERACNAINFQRGRGGNFANRSPNFNPRFNTSSTPPQQAFRPRFPLTAGQQNTRPYAQNRNPRGNLTQGAKRFPQPVYPNRTDLCFFHRTFGKDAVKHEEPCAWIYPKQENK